MNRAKSLKRMIEKVNNQAILKKAVKVNEEFEGAEFSNLSLGKTYDELSNIVKTINSPEDVKCKKFFTALAKTIKEIIDSDPYSTLENVKCSLDFTFEDGEARYDFTLQGKFFFEEDEEGGADEDELRNENFSQAIEPVVYAWKNNMLDFMRERFDAGSAINDFDLYDTSFVFNVYSSF